ncbi:MAPEG family protein [Primorskyibacter sp. S187A]|uniref:MAPEG family protein n=1 Tax=Primorskyibacter sp. S187A TaxID=3415130 RepID=UPI003C7A68DB
MTPELTALTLAALLQVIQFVLVSIPANLELGTKITLAPRDTGPLMEQVSPRTARLARAMNNHFEGLILFAIACLVITFSDQGDKYTAACAAIYVLARVLYIPAYAFGWAPWRSLIWMVGFGATTAMLVMALV